MSEFLKLAWWSGRRVSFSHYQTKDQDEVGVVNEDRRGRVVGIEVKASATVPQDFWGIAPVAGRSPRSFCARAGAARPSPCVAVRRKNCKLHRCRFCVRCKVA
ncbi:DUF4143 domain-containing protein [Mesorhizobium sp. M0751]|uniref:hypothetical protein n=1 Tax=unclassified Mesorhizobium TaxID=325217 RepID=UPI00333B2ABE